MGHVANVRGKKRTTYTFWWGNLKERYCLEDLGVQWRIILKWTEIKRTIGRACILLRDADKWRALVNMVMNLWVL
jgi:hypothetical protein